MLCLSPLFHWQWGKISLSRMHFRPKIWEDQFQHGHGLVTANGSELSFFRHQHRTLQQLRLCSANCKIWSNKIDDSYLLERQIKAICIFLIILQYLHTDTELIHNSVIPLIWVLYRRKQVQKAMKQIDVQVLGHLTLFFSQLLYISGITQTWTHQGNHQPRVAIYIPMSPNSIYYKFSLLYWSHFQCSIVTDKWLPYRTAQTLVLQTLANDGLDS